MNKKIIFFLMLVFLSSGVFAVELFNDPMNEGSIDNTKWEYNVSQWAYDAGSYKITYGGGTSSFFNEMCTTNTYQFLDDVVYWLNVTAERVSAGSGFANQPTLGISFLQQEGYVSGVAGDFNGYMVRHGGGEFDLEFVNGAFSDLSSGTYHEDRDSLITYNTRYYNGNITTYYKSGGNTAILSAVNTTWKEGHICLGIGAYAQTIKYYNVSLTDDLGIEITYPSESNFTINDSNFDVNFTIPSYLNQSNCSLYVNEIEVNTIINVTNNASLNSGVLGYGYYNYSVGCTSESETSNSSTQFVTLQILQGVVYEDTVLQSIGYTIVLTSDIDSDTAVLWYNGTEQSTTRTEVGGNSVYTKDLIAPFVSEIETLDFYFTITLNGTETNTSTYSQTVTPIILSTNCTLYPEIIANFTLKNQSATSILITGNLLGVFDSYTLNPLYASTDNFDFGSGSIFSLCGNSSGNDFTIDGDLQITATGFAPKTYTFDGADYTGTTLEYELFMVDETLSQAVTFFLYDADGSIINDGVLKIRQFNAGNNSYDLVESLSFSAGQTVGQIILNTVDYSFIITVDGVDYTKYINPVKITDVTKTFIIDTAGEALSSYYEQLDTTVILDYSYATDRGTFTWATSDNAAITGCLQLQETTALGTINSTKYCDTSGSASVSQILSTLDEKEYTLYATLESGDGLERVVDSIHINKNNPNPFGMTGVYASLLIIMAIPLAMGTGVASIVLGIILGLVGTFMIGMHSIGWGATSALIILGVIILSTMRRGN